MYATIDIPPGVFRNGTEYQTKGRWFDANLVRWRDGRMMPIGGWSRVTATPFSSKARAVLAWADNASDRWLAVATSTGLFVSHGTGTFTDITPGTYTAGSDDPFETLGYGGGNYGAGTYGTARPGGTFRPQTSWHLDTWGQELVACATTDGRLWKWDLNTANDAAAITNAPTGCTGLLVTDERHLLALGAGGNGRKVQWCDRENITQWTPAATNEAGSFELQTDSKIRCGIRVRGVNLILTDTDAHAMRYIGQPFIYSRERVGMSCGVISPSAAISVDSVGFWMGTSSFYVFDGATVRPLPCDVSDYVFSRLNSFNRTKIVCGHNGQFNEVIWFYPSGSSSEPDSYVAYNYKEGHWTIGSLARTAWHAGDVFGAPLAVGADNHLYRHEQDWTDNGAARFASIYAQSGAIEVGAGERVMEVLGVLPDEDQRGEVSVSFRSRFVPNGAESTAGPYVVRSDGYTDARFSGRQIVMRVQPVADGDWRVGSFRLDLRQAGKR